MITDSTIIITRERNIDAAPYTVTRSSVLDVKANQPCAVLQNMVNSKYCPEKL